MRLVLGFLLNLLGLYLASYLIEGFKVSGGWQAYVVAGLVLTFLNLIVKPILKLVTFPLIILTLGLFLIVINALLLWLASQFTNVIVIENLMSLLWATIILTIMNVVGHRLK